MNKIILLSLVVLASTLCGCAFDIVNIDQVPVRYENTSTRISGFELTDEVHIDLGTGYSRKLKKETEWNYVNTITQGDIFRTNDQILTIEGSNIFEAFIVVSKKQLVGFFLPVEGTYSQLDTPIFLPMARIHK